MFTQQNTDGYSQEALDVMNQKLFELCKKMGINPNDYPYNLDMTDYAIYKKIEEDVFNESF